MAHSCLKKERRTFSLAVTLNYFAKGDYSSAADLGEAKESYFPEAVRELRNEEWKANFTVSRETFRVLCTKLKLSPACLAFFSCCEAALPQLSLWQIIRVVLRRHVVDALVSPSDPLNAVEDISSNIEGITNAPPH